jgi:hypothetical protein|nr:MAG TPA: hypothetical protein [Crassvirales sp.]
MGTFEIAVCVTLGVLFLLASVISLRDSYETLQCKWIAKGRKMGLEQAKWNLEKVFPKLAPLDLRSPKEGYYKCDLLNVYTAEIVKLESDSRYIVLIKKYDCVLLKANECFFSLDAAIKFIVDFRINLLNSISNETV